MPTKKNKVRLAGHITPVHYEITLCPDLLAHTFTGEETITVLVDKPTKSITLHSKELSILSVKDESGNFAKVTYNKKLETATFTFKENFKKGNHKISISWTGVLSQNMRGFYKSRYVIDDKERYMATTQFEATDARRCLPCFDEPTHKAVFKVHLVIPNDRIAISNTLPETIREHESGYKIVSFAPTPKMSTYLLAFIVGDFEWIEAQSKNGVKVRVLTVPGKVKQGKFALDVTVKCLEFYEKYFGIKYPLNTLDMIAIPDFSSLAMENWGAITFREIGLLVDEGNTSTSARELIAIVIAHELAHQWFGNLVTMEWWTHLWLNEGFASYIPYLAIDDIFPEWNIWDQFATDDLAIALRLDALHNTHPIEVDVHDPNEIGEIFDAVSYSKGASVIRMLAEYLGKDMFRKGLAHYLKKHSYNNASTAHLWDAFEYISGKPVKKMMAVWTGKSGYPVLSAKKSGNQLYLSQKRYYSSIKSAKSSKDKTIWPIPLSVVTPRGEKNISLMTSKNLRLGLPSETWFKLNAHEGSLYRVNYSKEILEELSKPIVEGRISSADRLGVIRDMFALAEAGEIDTTDALYCASLYKEETEYIVWVELITGFSRVGNLLFGTSSYESYRAYVRDILASVINRVGWDTRTNESHNDSLLRGLVLGAGVGFGDKKTIDYALKLFLNRNDEPIHADLRGVVYGAVAKTGGEKEYNTLLSMYKNETLHEEKNRLLSALGMFKQKELLRKTLDFTMTDNVRMQDRNGSFASVMINPYGRALGWVFVKKNWKKIGEAYGDGNHLLSRLISVLNRNTSKKTYDDVKKFFKTHSAPSAERTIEQTLEYIDSNVRWLSRDEKKIHRFLKNDFKL